MYNWPSDEIGTQWMSKVDERDNSKTEPKKQIWEGEVNCWNHVRQTTGAIYLYFI